MRLHPTRAEAALWQHLRRKALGHRFHRQACMYGFIADFWCPKARLVVEVDGPIHWSQSEYDAFRDGILASHGIATLRFSNAAVLTDVVDVLSRIQHHMLGARLTRPG